MVGLGNFHKHDDDDDDEKEDDNVDGHWLGWVLFTNTLCDNDDHAIKDSDNDDKN